MCSINFGLTPARQRSSPAKGILLNRVPSVVQIFDSDISDLLKPRQKEEPAQRKISRQNEQFYQG